MKTLLILIVMNWQGGVDTKQIPFTRYDDCVKAGRGYIAAASKLESIYVSYECTTTSLKPYRE
jgi:hypothetical protein